MPISPVGSFVGYGTQLMEEAERIAAEARVGGPKGRRALTPSQTRDRVALFSDLRGVAHCLDQRLIRSRHKRLERGLAHYLDICFGQSGKPHFFGRPREETNLGEWLLLS